MEIYLQMYFIFSKKHILKYFEIYMEILWDDIWKYIIFLYIFTLFPIVFIEMIRREMQLRSGAEVDFLKFVICQKQISHFF